MTNNGEKRKEVELQGQIVKIGEKFCFPDLEKVAIRTLKNTKYMIGIIGDGPFELLGVTFFSRGGYPIHYLHFINNSGTEVEVNSEYFIKYEEVSAENIIPCEEGCKKCEEDEGDYQRLIKILSEMHLSNFKDPEALCSATFCEFNTEHPDYDSCFQMQGKLSIMAKKRGLL